MIFKKKLLPHVVAVRRATFDVANWQCTVTKVKLGEISVLKHVPTSFEITIAESSDMVLVDKIEFKPIVQNLCILKRRLTKQENDDTPYDGMLSMYKP